MVPHKCLNAQGAFDRQRPRIDNIRLVSEKLFLVCAKMEEDLESDIHEREVVMDTLEQGATCASEMLDGFFRELLDVTHPSLGGFSLPEVSEALHGHRS